MRIWRRLSANSLNARCVRHVFNYDPAYLAQGHAGWRSNYRCQSANVTKMPHSNLSHYMVGFTAQAYLG